MSSLTNFYEIGKRSYWTGAVYAGRLIRFVGNTGAHRTHIRLLKHILLTFFMPTAVLSCLGAHVTRLDTGTCAVELKAKQLFLAQSIFLGLRKVTVVHILNHISTFCGPLGF